MDENPLQISQAPHLWTHCLCVKRAHRSQAARLQRAKILILFLEEDRSKAQTSSHGLTLQELLGTFQAKSVLQHYHRPGGVGGIRQHQPSTEFGQDGEVDLR